MKKRKNLKKERKTEKEEGRKPERKKGQKENGMERRKNKAKLWPIRAPRLIKNL